MAKEYLKLLKQELKKQEAMTKTFGPGGKGWNYQLIEDMKAAIKRTEADIRELQGRLGHK